MRSRFPTPVIHDCGVSLLSPSRTVPIFFQRPKQRTAALKASSSPIVSTANEGVQSKTILHLAGQLLAGGVESLHLHASQAPLFTKFFSRSEEANGSELHQLLRRSMIYHVKSAAEVTSLPSFVERVAILFPISDLYTKLTMNCGLGKVSAAAHETLDAAKERNLDVTGCIPCALSCPFEGQQLPVRKTADATCDLIFSGCSQVLWDDGGGTCLPRHLENTIKAGVAAGGVDVCGGQVGLLLRPTTDPRLLHPEQQLRTLLRALELGMCCHVGSSAQFSDIQQRFEKNQDAVDDTFEEGDDDAQMPLTRDVSSRSQGHPELFSVAELLAWMINLSSDPIHHVEQQGKDLYQAESQVQEAMLILQRLAATSLNLQRELENFQQN